MPAFNTVFKRKNFASYLTDDLHFDGSQITAEKNLQWRNGLYFLMKEIYYNRFLQEKDLYERVNKILEERRKRISIIPNPKKLVPYAITAMHIEICLV